MTRLALLLLLSLLALGALGLAACGGGGDDDETTEVSEAAAATEAAAGPGGKPVKLRADPGRKSCGVVLGDLGRPFWLAVFEGDVSCRVARRAMQAWAAKRDTGSWSCISGPQSHLVCKKGLGKTISANWLLDRPSDEEIITKTGNEWASLFAKGGERCRYMGQPACRRAACGHVGNAPIPGCTPLSSELRKSFANAMVERVVVEGRHAEAKFSNGLSVEFEGQKADGGDRQPVGEHWARFWFVTERWVKETSRAADYKFCGGFSGPRGRIMVEVLEGNVPCGAARRVLEDSHRGAVDDLVNSKYRGQFALVGSWKCWGPDSSVACRKRTRASSARTIRAHWPNM